MQRDVFILKHDLKSVQRGTKHSLHTYVRDGKDLKVIFRCWLTSVDFALFLDIPGVKRGSFGRLHRCAFIQVLRQVRLIETRHVHHLALRNIVLLHVSFDSARHAPRVLTNNETTHRYEHSQVLTLHYCYVFMYFRLCIIMPFCLEKPKYKKRLQTSKI